MTPARGAGTPHRTPHESLPLKRAAHRQFFRLVVGKIDVWYARHSTPNPACPVPDDVHISHVSKFETQRDPHLKTRSTRTAMEATHTALRLWDLYVRANGLTWPESRFSASLQHRSKAVLSAMAALVGVDVAGLGKAQIIERLLAVPDAVLDEARAAVR